MAISPDSKLLRNVRVVFKWPSVCPVIKGSEVLCTAERLLSMIEFSEVVPKGSILIIYAILWPHRLRSLMSFSHCVTVLISILKQGIRASNKWGIWVETPRNYRYHSKRPSKFVYPEVCLNSPNIYEHMHVVLSKNRILFQMKKVAINWYRSPIGDREKPEVNDGPLIWLDDGCIELAIMTSAASLKQSRASESRWLVARRMGGPVKWSGNPGKVGFAPMAPINCHMDSGVHANKPSEISP